MKTIAQKQRLLIPIVLALMLVLTAIMGVIPVNAQTNPPTYMLDEESKKWSSYAFETSGDAELVGWKQDTASYNSACIVSADKYQAGGVFTKYPINSVGGFSTAFRMYMGRAPIQFSNDGDNIYQGDRPKKIGDGFCFVMSQQSNVATDADGGGLGYAGMPGKSYAVEYDTYDPRAAYSTQIGLNVDGQVDADGGDGWWSPYRDVYPFGTHNVGTGNDGSVVWSPTQLYAGASVWEIKEQNYVWGWIDYDANSKTLYVRFSKTSSRPAEPTVTYADVDMSDWGNDYYLGFTGATGGNYQQISVTDWSIVNTYCSNGASLTGASTWDLSFPPDPIITINEDRTEATVTSALLADGVTKATPVMKYRCSTDEVFEWKTLPADGKIRKTGANPNEDEVWYVLAEEGNNLGQTKIVEVRFIKSTPITVKFDYVEGYTQATGSFDIKPSGTSLPENRTAMNGLTYGQIVQEDGFPMPTISGQYDGKTYVFVGYTMNDYIGGFFNQYDNTFDDDNICLPGSEAANKMASVYGTAPNEYTYLYAFYAPGNIITFNMNGHGTQIPQIGIIKTGSYNSIVYSGGVTYAPKEPTEAGWRFLRWEKGGKPFEFGYGLSGNITLDAVWEKVDYNVTYEKNGGEGTAESVTVSWGGAITLPTLTKSDNLFDGWYTKDGTDGDWGTKFDYTIMPDMGIGVTDVTLYAKWKPAYTVRFDLKGHGEAIPNRVLIVGVTDPLKITVPPEPEEEGWAFEGWCTDDGCLTQFDFDSLITTSATLYAKWTKETYTIMFERNGGTGTAEPITALYGATVSMPTIVKDGYIFNGWFTADGTDDSWGLNKTAMTTMPDLGGNNENVTFYAKWTAKSYTINWNGNAGSNGMVADTEITQEFGSTVTIPTPVYTPNADKPQLYFIGWFENADGTGNQFTSTVMPDLGDTGTEKTFYAKWVEGYPVTFNMNGRGTSPNSQLVIPNSANLKATRPETDPTTDGYSFVNWYTTADGDVVFDFANTTITGVTTIYAKWEAKTDTAYKVEHYQQNVTGDEYTLIDADTEDKTGTTATDTSAVAKTYTGFVAVTDGANAWAQLTIAANGSTVVKIYYNRTTHTIIYQNGETELQKTENVRYGATTPTYDGTPTKTPTNYVTYTFKDFGTVPETVSEDATYTATFTQTPITYTVTLTVNGGTVNVGDVTSYVAGTGATLPTDVTQANKAFDGWYDNPEFSGTAVTQITETDYANKTYYAKWLDGYYITFNMNGHGAQVPQTLVLPNNKITGITVPTADGYTFDGWYKEEGLANKWNLDSDLVNQERTLYAKWTATAPEVVVNTAYVSNNLPDAICYTAYTKATAPVLIVSISTGGTYTFASTNLPAGMVINPTTGIISGTPTTAYPDGKSITVKVTTGAGATAEKQLNIVVKKADFTVTADDVVTTYDSTKHEITLQSVTATDVITYCDTADGEFSAEQPLCVYAGVYTVYYKVHRSDNYNDVSGSATVTVNKATMQSTDVVISGNEVAYDGNAHVITVTCSSQTDVISYSLAQNGTYGAHPRCVDVGEYTIWVKVTRANYKDYYVSAVLKITGAEEETFSVSIMVLDNNNQPLKDAVVVLKAGATVYFTGVTDSEGKTSISGLVSKLYNIVVVYNYDPNPEVEDDEVATTTTKGLNLQADANMSITMPALYLNSIVEVEEEVPEIVVDGLADEFSDEEKGQVSEDTSIEIKMTVEAVEEPSTGITEEIGNLQLGFTVDINVLKTTTTNGVAGTSEVIKTTNGLIKITIPLPADYQGKASYVVLREHDGEINKITTKANEQGEYLEINKEKTVITLYVKNFSQYAVAYSTNNCITHWVMLAIAGLYVIFQVIWTFVCKRKMDFSATLVTLCVIAGEILLFIFFTRCWLCLLFFIISLALVVGWFILYWALIAKGNKEGAKTFVVELLASIGTFFVKTWRVIKKFFVGIGLWIAHLFAGKDKKEALKRAEEEQKAALLAKTVEQWYEEENTVLDGLRTEGKDVKQYVEKRLAKAEYDNHKTALQQLLYEIIKEQESAERVETAEVVVATIEEVNEEVVKDEEKEVKANVKSAEANAKAFVQAKKSGSEAKVPKLTFSLSCEDVYEYVEQMEGENPVKTSVIVKQEDSGTDILRVGQFAFAYMTQRKDVIRFVLRLSDASAKKLEESHTGFSFVECLGANWYELVVDSSYPAKESVYAVLDDSCTYVKEVEFATNDAGKVIVINTEAKIAESDNKRKVEEYLLLPSANYETAINERINALALVGTTGITRAKLVTYTKGRFFADCEIVERPEYYKPVSFKACGLTFASVYESKGIVRIVIRTDKEYEQKHEKLHPQVFKSKFPKGKDWHTFIMDGTFETVEEAYSIVKHAYLFTVDSYAQKPKPVSEMADAQG